MFFERKKNKLNSLYVSLQKGGEINFKTLNIFCFISIYTVGDLIVHETTL